MLFNSIDFLIFFPLVVTFYFIIPYKFRWLFLLAASYYFYASANGKLILLIILSTIIDYLIGLKMSGLESKKERKPYLILSLVTNLLILGIFKYYDFFADSFSELLHSINVDYSLPIMSLILPIGISFYTLQTLSYSIDIYKGRLKAEKNLGKFALFVCFFPQLVAGPIERARNLLPQLYKKVDPNPKEISNGLKLMGLGFFKKVVVADQIAPMIKFVNESPNDFGGLSILICALLFFYQVYCDFSGYSDIAIGAAQTMGIKLMLNFRRPFVATSLSEMWSRWHISLIQWFRDYIFIPITKGSSMRKVYIGTMIVFFVSGLWHGASYNFIIWGFLNGLVIVLNRIVGVKKYSIKYLKRYRQKKWYVFLLRWKTYSIASIIGIFFFTSDFITAKTLISNLNSNWLSDIIDIINNNNDKRVNALYLGYNFWQFIFLLASIVTLEIIHFIQERYGSARQFLDQKPTLIKWSLYSCLVLSVVLLSFDREVPFIYFQF